MKKSDKQTKEWNNMSNGEKVLGVAIVLVLLVGGIFLIGSLFSGGASKKQESSNAHKQEQPKQSTEDRIKSSMKDGKCSLVNYTPSDKLLSVSTGYSSAVNNFVKTGIVAFDIEGCNEFTYTWEADVTNSKGDVTRTKVLELAATKEQFEKYEWDNLLGSEIGRTLSRNGFVAVFIPMSDFTPEKFNQIRLESID